MSLRVLVGLLLLGASSGLVLAEEAWSTAESAAVSEWKNGEGKGYGKALEKAFPKDHGATLSACASELPKPDFSKFTVLLRLDAQGVVEAALVNPATNMAVCLQDKMKGWKTLPPLHGGFWAKLALKLKAN